MNTTAVPACMERLVEGFKRILAATGEDPGGLWPPHADKSTKLEMMTTIHAHWPKRNLPMHPLAASWWYPIRRIASLEWKTCSLENEDGFSKLGRRALFRRASFKPIRKGCMTGWFRLRQWDAKRWVDDVSMELL